MHPDKKDLLLNIGLPILIALLSFFLFRPMTVSSGFTEYSSSFLDEKRATVLEITAASTASSAAITLMPGDAGTPIASKLADISEYSVIILCAVLLEKYLAMLMGHVSFGIMVPFACAMWIIAFWIRSHSLRQAAIRLATFGILLTLVIPCSVKASQVIENTSRESIQTTIDTANESAQEIQQNAIESENNKTLWERFISTIEGGTAAITQKFEGILNSFIEAVAIMLVTSCVIPLLTLLLMMWMVKALTQNYDGRIPFPEIPSRLPLK